MAGSREIPEQKRASWPVAVSFLIDPLDESFSLADVYALSAPLRYAFPDNNHVEAKIRQSLQMLRDRGHIAFEGNGMYRKLVAVEPRSIRLDFAAAARLTSRSQIARVAVEAWAARNVGCRRCGSDYILVPTNTPLLDAVCRSHFHELQIKGVAGIADDRLMGAAYAPLAERLAVDALPDYLIVSYDRMRAIVTLAEFIDGTAIAASRVVARTALSPTARRAGWVGATIDLADLPRDVIVGPSFSPEVDRWGPTSL